MATICIYTCFYFEETSGATAEVKFSYAHADRSRRKIHKICGNHLKKSVGSTKFCFSALGLFKILQSHSSNEERLVAAVGTRFEAKPLDAPLFTTSAHGKT